jgi:taurine transport system substrate-binding protein
MPRSRTRPLRTLLLAAVLATSLTACVQSGRSSSGPAGAKAECPWKADPTVTGKIRLGWQASPTPDLIVKDRGWLEACMPKANIQWSKFASGADVVQAFGAKSIDLALIGSSPATIAVSAPLDLPVKVVWIQEVIGTAESLVSRDASIAQVADLKGKTVAVPYGSTAHFSLLQALAGAGLTPDKDVKLVNLAPDAILAAWQGKQVDAAWIWNPVQAQLLAKGGKVIYSSADTAKAGKPTFDLSAATSDLVANNKPFMEQWTKAEDAAVKMIKDKPQDAADSMSVQMGSSSKEVQDQFAGYTYLSAEEQAQQQYLGGKLGADLFTTAKFLLSQGSIDAVSPEGNYAKAVDPAPAASVGQG